jgi:ArsR family transcriptional regulator, repressor of sdpIR and other operons
MGNLGKIFQAMSDPTRRRILELLREGELAAGKIAEQFRMTKPAISHHLAVLTDAGLAVQRREGQHIIYALREDSILETWNGFLSKLCTKKRKKGERK